nr:hypothetical protein GCM10020092_078960 [Actinoplanes digitatis]
MPDSAGFSSPWQPSPLSYIEYVALRGDGPIGLDFAVHDELGNPATLSNRVTVDNTKATVAFAKAPKNKAKVKGTVKVTATARDKYGVARVQLLINGKVVATDTTAAYKFSINTKKYGKKLKVRLRVYDRAEQRDHHVNPYLVPPLTDAWIAHPQGLTRPQYRKSGGGPTGCPSVTGKKR